jgi:E3 ubiquitin-protein ligase SHPRH
MRTDHSQHSESVRKRPLHFWPNVNPPSVDWRPTLNFAALAELLKDAAGASDASKGKKRAAFSSPSNEHRLPKRYKPSEFRSQTPSNSSSEASGDESDKTEPETASPSDNMDLHMPYPVIYENDRASSEASVPVYRHVFDVGYTTRVPSEDEDVEGYMNDASAKASRWAEQEEGFMALLRELYGSISEPITVDLGKICFGLHGSRLAARASNRRDHYMNGFVNPAQHQWLMLIPTVDADIDIYGYDYSSEDVQDLLLACFLLEHEGRVDLEGNAHFIALPSGIDKDVHDLPFRLRIEINVSLRLPDIFQPIFSARMSQRKMVAIEDTQRRVLSHVFPPSSPTTELPPYPDETNIPFFYSILNPAPRLMSIMAQDSMQPEALRPSLLPFQRRSVAWLLEREGKTVTSAGQIMPISESTASLPLFWDKIEREGDLPPWYLHRPTGSLSLEAPLAYTAFGGILAEEPGLGKTLECIALVLLNPAPSRNPSVKLWDAEAGLHVKEIKASNPRLTSYASYPGPNAPFRLH